MIRVRLHSGRGFTLIEILLASAAAALILAAVYGVFTHAMHLRDSATQRIHDTRLRDRAAAIIRNDLRNALISGGLFASLVQGDSNGTDGENSEMPGYLKLTTTTGKDTDDALYGDVQQVEYYVIRSSTGSAVTGGGTLVRAVTRDLLDTDPQPLTQDVLYGVQSFHVTFYDGTNWDSSWEFNTADNASSSSGSSSASTSGTSTGASTSGSNGNTETLPLAIRVDVQQVPQTVGGTLPAPIEVLVPWTTQPFTSPTPAPSASPT
jgi:prepilin-type N-terminal cleavage/methylation domain-containing protein